jgi:hypothetical protein
MSEHEKLDTWGKWRRDAVQDYGNASLRYAQQGRKFMSALAAVGEAAADLAPHSAKGVAFELATMATGLGPISKGLKAVGAAKDVINAVKMVEHVSEAAHLGTSIVHSGKNVYNAVAPAGKTGSINTPKATGVYTALSPGFLKSIKGAQAGTQSKSTTGSKVKATKGTNHTTASPVKHGATVLASKVQIRTLNTTKPLVPKTASNTMSFLKHKINQPKAGIKSATTNHMSLMNRKLSGPKPIAKSASNSMNTIRRATVPRPISRPMGKR